MPGLALPTKEITPENTGLITFSLFYLMLKLKIGKFVLKKYGGCYAIPSRVLEVCITVLPFVGEALD